MVLRTLSESSLHPLSFNEFSQITQKYPSSHFQRDIPKNAHPTKDLIAVTSRRSCMQASRKAVSSARTLYPVLLLRARATDLRPSGGHAQTEGKNNQPEKYLSTQVGRHANKSFYASILAHLPACFRSLPVSSLMRPANQSPHD